MKVFVTGATGFVGRYVVARLVANGHEVTAFVRPTSPVATLQTAIETGHVTVARGELSTGLGLADAMSGHDVIVHLAAVKGGDYFSRFAGTVVGTENLLKAAQAANVTELVAISTFSVYEYAALKAGSLFDESAPVVTNPKGRDEYTETKMYQDELYQDFGALPGNRMVMIRPGMIYGRGEEWHPLLGGDLGPVYLRIGSKVRPPIVYVENVADAIALAAQHLHSPANAPVGDIDGLVINLVDDHLPTQDEYVNKLKVLAIGSDSITFPRYVKVPFQVMKAAAVAAQAVNVRVFKGRAKLPGVAVPAQIDARFKSFRYSNQRAKSALGWSPRFSLDTALERCVSKRDLAADILAAPAQES